MVSIGENPIKEYFECGEFLSEESKKIAPSSSAKTAPSVSGKKGSCPESKPGKPAFTLPGNKWPIL